MSDNGHLDITKAQPSARPRTLETFMGYLSAIAPHPERQITPQSHLVDDLGFDSIDFGCLGLLVAERYGIGGVSAESLQSESLTVEGFFKRCILYVLGVGPER